MSRTPVLTSLLETDLYKLTMWQALLHRHPATQAEYRFVCRNPQAAAFPLAELRAEVEAELDHLCALSFTAAELDWLGRLRFIRPDFVDFLRSSASSATSSRCAPRAIGCASRRAGRRSM